MTYPSGSKFLIDLIVSFAARLSRLPHVRIHQVSTESSKQGDGNLLPALNPAKQSLTGDGDMASPPRLALPIS
jgi:hypothetical protein